MVFALGCLPVSDLDVGWLHVVLIVLYFVCALLGQVIKGLLHVLPRLGAAYLRSLLPGLEVAQVMLLRELLRLEELHLAFLAYEDPHLAQVQLITDQDRLRVQLLAVLHLP